MQQTDPEVIEYLRRAAVASEESLRISKNMMRVTKWLVVTVIALFALSIGFNIYLGMKDRERQTTSNWYGVDFYYKYQQLDSTLWYLDRILKAVPREYEAHYFKGEVLLMKGDVDGARKSFQAAMDIFPIPAHKEAVEALTPRAKEPN